MWRERKVAGRGPACSSALSVVPELLLWRGTGGWTRSLAGGNRLERRQFQRDRRAGSVAVLHKDPERWRNLAEFQSWTMEAKRRSVPILGQHPLAKPSPLTSMLPFVIQRLTPDTTTELGTLSGGSSRSFQSTLGMKQRRDTWMPECSQLAWSSRRRPVLAPRAALSVELCNDSRPFQYRRVHSYTFLFRGAPPSSARLEMRTVARSAGRNENHGAQTSLLDRFAFKGPNRDRQQLVMQVRAYQRSIFGLHRRLPNTVCTSWRMADAGGSSRGMA